MAGTIQLEPERDSLIGQHVGPYRLVAELGRGGMGIVYLGERDDAQFERRVAIKVIHRTTTRGKTRTERFRRERQILADFDHPAIARLFEGGSLADGSLYLVMELVEGEPIHVYCQRRGLPVRERLRLFHEVCAAVAYAHRRLVVHRDLKPSNILVTASGQPKLLDFGIAKLLDESLRRDEATDDGELLCTPAYASPEQLRWQSIGTPSDVYSLGVILYELLVGRRPHGGPGTSLFTLIQDVLAATPTLPSRAVEEAPPTVPVDGLSRPSEPLATTAAPAAPAELRGDLDALVLAALAKNPDERYPSAEALAADVDRYLTGFPLAARSPTRAYRAAKFVRRHLWGVAAGLAFVVLLASFATTMAVQSRRLARERDRAEREQKSAEQVTDFLVRLFQIPDPGSGQGRNVTAGEILDHGAQSLARELSGQPVVEARMAYTIAETYRSLGLYREATDLHRRALDLRRQHLGPDDPELVRSLAALGLTLALHGDYEAAAPYADEALERGRRLEGEDDVVAFALNSLGIVRWFQGAYAEAEPLYREALELAEATHGADSLEAARLRHNLAILLGSLGRTEQSRDLHREALAVHRQLLGNDHPTTATSLNNLGTALAELEDWTTAEACFTEALALRRKLLGNDHPWVASTLGNLAAALHARGDYPGAITAYEEALAIQRRTLGDDNPATAGNLHAYGLSLLAAGRAAEAETNLRQALAVGVRLLPPEHPFQAQAATSLARLHLSQGDFAAAEGLLRQAVAIQEASLDQGSPELAETRLLLGQALLRQGQTAAARALLEAAQQVLVAVHGQAAEGPREAAALLAEAQSTAIQASKASPIALGEERAVD